MVRWESIFGAEHANGFRGDYGREPAESNFFFENFFIARKNKGGLLPPEKCPAWAAARGDMVEGLRLCRVKTPCFSLKTPLPLLLTGVFSIS